MENLIFTAFWWGLGVAPWIYGWTKKHDLTIESIIGFGFLGLLMGPLSFFIAPIFFSEPKASLVLMKKWGK